MDFLIPLLMLTSFCFSNLFARFLAKITIPKLCSTFSLFLRDLFLSFVVLVLEIQNSFKVPSTWKRRLKPQFTGKCHLCSEPGTAPIGLSRPGGIRERRFWMTGYICSSDNGGDSICTKTIIVQAQFAASFELLTPLSEDGDNTNLQYIWCRINQC